MSFKVELLEWLVHGKSDPPKVVLHPDWCVSGNIESIDVDPKGNRVVTVGDGLLFIWDAQTSSSRLEHLLAVKNLTPRYISVAKWDASGSQLAFAGGQEAVGVLRKFPGVGMIQLEDYSKPSTENWQAVVAFKGHRSDVVDVAWNGLLHLATASLDNTIIIWNAQTGHSLQSLQGHRSFVKALAWDPAEVYIGSISDDRSLVIWNVATGVIEQVIKQPYVENPVSCRYNLRIDWSPDGLKLVAVNVRKYPNLANLVIIHRGDWRREYRGIEGPGCITLAKFNPYTFEKNQKKFYYWCTGGTSGLVSVWADEVGSTGDSPRSPPETINVKSAVTDLTWCPDGFNLLIATSIGQVLKWTIPQELLGCKVEEDRCLPPSPLCPTAIRETEEFSPRPRSGKKRICPERVEQEFGVDENKRTVHEHRFRPFGKQKKNNELVNSFQVPVKTRRSDRYLVQVRNRRRQGLDSSLITFQEPTRLVWTLKRDISVLLSIANLAYLCLIMSDNSLEVFDLRSGSFLMRWKTKGIVWCIDCDEISTLMIITKDKIVHLLNLSLFKEEISFTLPLKPTTRHNPVLDLRLSGECDIIIQTPSSVRLYTLSSQSWTERPKEELQADFVSFHVDPGDSEGWDVDDEERISEMVLSREEEIWTAKQEDDVSVIHKSFMGLADLLLSLYSKERWWTGRKLLFLLDRISSEREIDDKRFREEFMKEVQNRLKEDKDSFQWILSDKRNLHSR